ncbi:LLM class flavin-dependent oxidoreductase [Patulibacter minatonensis]|uniref:LLM class flavin-dependent oxidoreductase n=1 Tax=Patulibacter minatonensis TaxID=298163 RepID=UPI0006854E0B|nr:LLM class flavin-dependent oxidoreductase [Patulibacter minatonensis]
MSHRPLLLAAALADRRPLPDRGALVDRARTAEAAGLELVTIEPGPFDPLLVAAHLAARTSRIGIAPVVSTTTTEPFHVSTALATIDVVAHGRGGWVAQVDDPADVDGTVTWDVTADAAGDAAEHLEAVRALWDSWEDGAEIRDVATARFIDRDRVHHVDLVGEHLSVRGPSITPRPPQGHPVVLARADGPAAERLVAAGVDVLVAAEGAPSAAPRRFVDVVVAADAHDGLAARLIALHADGADGVVLHAEDLAGALAAVLPELERAGVRPAADDRDGPPPGGPADPEDPAGPAAPPTLRERLGLAPAVNRFEARA